jgi:hypothetical protein
LRLIFEFGPSASFFAASKLLALARLERATTFGSNIGPFLVADLFAAFFPITPAGFLPAIFAVSVARFFPLAVFSLPPLAVAPVLENLPMLSLLYARFFPPPPPPRPFDPPFLDLAMATAIEA